MTWPVNHMVSPKETTVRCAECHAREGGRLAGLGGLYLPGRDANPWVEGLGAGVLALTVGAAAVHGGLRIAARRKRTGG
jgi:hypothetical protein